MKKHQSFVLLICVLQCSIKYLDECLGLAIGKEPVFKMDLKMAAKTLLTKLELWLQNYYKMNISDISELNNQVNGFIDIFENSAKIAFQINERPENEGNQFQTDFDQLLLKHNIKL